MMEHNIVEEKRNKLNLGIRSLLTVIDLIDGKQKKYEDYITDSLNEIEFLEQQIKLVDEAKERLIMVFKD
jgi:hypothetical protein